MPPRFPSSAGRHSFQPGGHSSSDTDLLWSGIATKAATLTFVARRTYVIAGRFDLTLTRERSSGSAGWSRPSATRCSRLRTTTTRTVFNGDLGLVRKVDVDEAELSVDFDGRLVVYDFGELDELMPAYAMTIHKSQGSEFPAIVIAVHTQHYVMLQRNLLYTGITRGKRLVALLGTAGSAGISAKRAESSQRCSALRSRLHDNQGQR
jgi:hypothetical protein